MNKCFTIFFLICFFQSSGQFAIINDEDGYVNVREDGSNKNKVIDKLNNGHLIYCFENKGNWTNIDYTNNNKECNGYVYKDKYKFVSNYKEIPIKKQSGNSKVIFSKDSISVTLTMTAFEKKKHHYKYVKDFPDQILLIDNKNYWGRDGGMPVTQFDKITIEIGKTNLLLPKVALEGLYEPNIFSAEINYDKENNILYIQTTNSDGAGSYEVIWKIEKGEYKERLVAYGF